MGLLSIVSSVVLSATVSFFAGFFYRKNIGEKQIGSAEKLADDIVQKAEAKLKKAEEDSVAVRNNAETRKKEILLDAKESAIKLKDAAEREIRSQKSELQLRENHLIKREETVEKKRDALEKKEDSLNKRSLALDDRANDINKLYAEQKFKLQELSGLSKDEARKLVLESVKDDVSADAAKIIKDIEFKAKIDADKRVVSILMNAMQRCNVDHISESTVSVVNLPNDDMKGKIIGREGRNIRLIESLTGVDLIIDDTPEAILLSCFDPIRREIARIALERLVSDGRIHQTRIEEVIEKSKKDFDGVVYEEGESATYEVGIQNLHPELTKLLGRMKYRTSYGQNALKHSVEVAHLSGLIASELGVDINMAKRAGLLHDIGKAVDHEVEGSHVSIGVSLCKKYKEPDIVINTIESHHGDVEPNSVIAVIVKVADAISAARPGARRETLESYIKRLDDLEKITDSFSGVEKSFAIHAGRELRIIVVPDEVSDVRLPLLARDIARKIEEELEYPGQIKVNIVRETRAIEYAK